MHRSDVNNKIVQYLKSFNPSRIGIFGSFARGDVNSSSDIDILVSFKGGLGLLQLVRIERELSNVLGKKVDLVTERSLKNEKLKKYIYNDLQIIFE